MTKITVHDRHSKELGTFELFQNTVSELQTLIKLKCTIYTNRSPQGRVSPERQRLTAVLSNGSTKVLQPNDNLEKLAITDVVLKDLGPQIGWQTVFLIEYLGPLIIHPACYFGYSAFGATHSSTQALTLILCVLHFLKREYETLNVHRFSSEYMPLMNLPKNCFHYWIFGGLLIAGPVYNPSYAPSLPWHASSFTSQAVVTIFWIFAQISNYKTHMILRNLRPQGSKVRKVPFGYGFNWVSCPNYTFEILGWTCVTLLTGSLFGK